MSEMFELKRGVQDSINIIKRNIKAYVFEEDNSVYRTVAVELRKLLLDKNAPATFIEKGKKNNKSLFELYYGDGADILLQSFLNPRENTKKTESNSHTVTSAFYLNRVDILHKAIGESNLVSLNQWLDEPLLYHKSKLQTLHMILNHIADKEGAHIINPEKRKDNIMGTTITLVSEPITSSNVPFLVASDNNWTQFIIDVGMRLLNARKASDKKFLIKHNIIIPENYSSAQIEFRRGKILMKEAEHQVNTEIKKGKYKEAIKVFDKAINLDPNNANIYNSRGIAKSSLGQHADAIDDCNKAVGLRSNYAMAYHSRGVAKSHLGQHADAIDDYDNAIELKPNEALFYNNRGITKSHLGQHADAINDCSKAIELKPDYAMAYNSRGIAKSHLGQHADAINDFSKAIELKPNEALFYNNRGITKSHLGQHADAINDCSKAIELKPDYAFFYRNRGIAKAKLKPNNHFY